MAIRVILLAGDPELQRHYEEAVTRMGAEVDTVETFGEMFNLLRQNAYHCLLIDLLAKTQGARTVDKVFLNNTLGTFPVAQLRWDPHYKKIHALLSVPYNGEDPLGYMLRQICPRFNPRRIRSATRFKLHFNLLLSKNREGLSDSAERVVTVNMSKEGCYIYSSQIWQDCRRVWFVIHELEDATPICGEIRWKIPWGEKMKFSGIGVLFTQIKAAQQQELASWMG
jgi:hypothetical protein